MAINQKILEKIISGREITKPFDQIIDGFKKKLIKFNPTENYIKVEEYFGINKGTATAKKLLLENKIIKPDWINENNNNNDFKGLYVFLSGQKPFYVGISKGVIGRTLQHVKGTNHNTSTLAYKIGLLKYELENKKKFEGERKDLNLVSEVEPVKVFLMKQNIAFIPIENDEELILFEIFCSMEFRTILNAFETH